MFINKTYINIYRFIKNQLSFKICLISLLIVFYSLNTYSQEIKITNKTNKIELINGKRYYIHTILKGQTLYSIAKAYNVTLEEIYAENPETKKLYDPDQKIKIPVKGKDLTPVKTENTVAVKDSFINHTVESKETLYSLSKKYEVSVEEIKNANPTLDANIQLGQLIKIPYKIDKKKKQGFLSSLFKKSPKPPVKKDSIATTKPVVIVKEVPKEAASSPCKESFNNEQFKLALMLPFYLYKLDDIIIDSEDDLKPASFYKSFNSIQFYEGMLLAIDSVVNQGLNLKLFVYDVSNDSSEVKKIINSSEFSGINMIMGHVNKKSSEVLANYAKKHNIKLISSSLNNNEVFNDVSSAFIVNPNINIQLKKLATFVDDKYKKDNIIIVYRSSNHNENKLYQIFKKEFDKTTGKYTSVEYNKLGFSYLSEHLSNQKNNVIITFLNEEAMLSNYIRSLNNIKDQYQITLYGLPSWSNFQNIEADYLQNLNLCTFSNAFIDYDNDIVKDFIRKFRNSTNTEPNISAFQGYSSTYYFLFALLKYGKNFEKCLSNIKLDLPAYNFNFEKLDDNCYDNTNINILQYQDFKINNLKNNK